MKVKQRQLEKHRQALLSHIEHAFVATSSPAFPKRVPTLAWVDSFLLHHKTVKLVAAKDLESERVQFATKSNIEAYFKSLCDLVKLHKYHLSMVCNCDETMLKWGKSRAKVIVGANMKRGYRHTPNVSMHITMEATIWLDGTCEKALVILPLKNLPADVAKANFQEFDWRGQENGWIDKDIFEEHCRNVVIPSFVARRTKLGDPNARGLFLVDGHTSRINDQLMQKFKDNLIDVVTFVSHTSHLLQPLDLCVFGVFKSSFTCPIDLGTDLNVSAVRLAILRSSNKSFQKSMIRDYIQTSFARAGIVLDEDGNVQIDSSIVLGRDGIIDDTNAPRPSETDKPKENMRFAISNRKLTQDEAIEEMKQKRIAKEAKDKAKADKKAAKGETPKAKKVAATKTKKRKAPTPAPPVVQAPVLVRRKDLILDCFNCKKNSAAIREWWTCPICLDVHACVDCFSNKGALGIHNAAWHPEIAESKKSRRK